MSSNKNLTVCNTDGYKGYSSFFKDKKEIIHTTTKAKTTNVESFNSILRANIPSLARKTKVVNRSNTELYNKIYTFCVIYNRKIKNILDFLNYFYIFAKSKFLNGSGILALTY